jgi:hypothetical protein
MTHDPTQTPRSQDCPPNYGGGDSLDDLLLAYSLAIRAADLGLSDDDIEEFFRRTEGKW